MNKIISFLVVAAGIFFGALAFAQTSGNGSLTLVKEISSGLFTLTVSDAEGVASFALEFKTGKLPYSGDLSGCNRSKKIDQIAAINDSDLAETIKGRVTDCRGGETEFEISTVDAKGRAQVKKLGIEPEPEPAPAPTPAPVKKSAEPAKTPAPTPTAFEIIYPVPELGNCKDKEECFAYCELSENGKQCLEFAKKHGLLPEDEIRIAEKVLGVKGGPGGCNSKKTCEAYCNDIDHIEECLAFAEENGLMKGSELEEAKKVRAAVQRGQKLPGGCKNKNACENYCKSSEHIDECLAFAEEAGFLSPEELEQAKKFMPLMKSGKTPGKCATKDECEAYCESDEHIDECIDFAVKNDMIPQEEREHIEAFKKAGGKGPGGCKGRQCQAFCENPDNQQTCFEWAKENGILKEEDLRRMKEGTQQIEKVFNDAPPEVQECIEQAVPGGLEKMRSGGFFGGEAVGEKIKACFEGFMSQMGGSFGGEHGGPGGGSDFSGPGGCKGPEECMSYCKENPEECQSFAPPGGGDHGMPGGGTGGPGGCKSKEECQAYCEANPKECEGFAPPNAMPFDNTRGGPGGCRSFEDCQNYCQTHPDEEQCKGSPAARFQGGKSEEFPTGEFHPPEGAQQNFQKEFEKQGAEQFQQQYQQESQKQSEEQYRKQYEQQYQQQYQQQSGGFHPPEGTFTQPPPPPLTSAITSPLGLLLAPFVDLIR